MSRSRPTPNESHLDYRQLFQNLPEPYLVFDATTPGFPVVDLNEARATATQTRRAEIIGRPWSEVLAMLSVRDEAVRGLVKLNRQMRRIVRTGQPEPLEVVSADITDERGHKHRHYWQPACILLRDDAGKIAYVLVWNHDVTEERRVARRALRTESRLEAALSIGKIGSWVWDVQSDQVVLDNNFLKLFGLSRERARELKMQDVFDSVHPDDRARIKRAIRRSVAERRPFEEENRVALRNGELRWVLSRGQTEEVDGIVTVTGVVVDITERRNLQAEVALARRQDRLNRRAAKMLQDRNVELEAIARSKDEFVALASHQLRTPATAVKQYLGMVLQGYAGDITAVQADMLHKAFESNERQIRIINQILNAARADTGRLVMAPLLVDMRLLTQNVIAEMRPTFEQHQHDVDMRLSKHPVMVMADQAYLRMAIENVLNNACGYTPNGGLITVRLSRAGGRCILRITDTGVGIRKADYGKLFAKFSRIHNPLSVQAGGSGIGLYLTAEIIRLNQGEISVDSKLRKGTTFAISLPLVQNTD